MDWISRPEQKSERAQGPPLILDSAEGSLPSIPGISADRLLVSGKEPLPIRTAHPPPPGARQESLLSDRDRRTRVLDTDALPWRMIAALEVEFPSLVGVGTGWLAGPDIMITAGHCVFDPECGGWASRIIARPGLNGDREPYEALTIDTMFVPEAWYKARDLAWDAAILQLPHPVGDDLGWFGVGLLPDQALNGARLNICGYPADRGFGTEQYFMANRVAHVGPDRLFYEIDTMPGQSGSPVWLYKDADTDKRSPIAVGLHAYGASKAPDQHGTLANSGTRLRDELFKKINESRKDAEPAKAT